MLSRHSEGASHREHRNVSTDHRSGHTRAGRATLSRKAYQNCWRGSRQSATSPAVRLSQCTEEPFAFAGI